jgi:RecA DNA recombination protein
MSSLAVVHTPVQSCASILSDCSASKVFFNDTPAEEHCVAQPGVLVQLCCGLGMSSGRTAFLFSAMAQLTRNDHFCALVDAGDCFDPTSAEAAGVELDRVLWVRCGQNAAAGRKLNPLEQAFKAADILVQNGGFQLIAVDLGNIQERRLRKVPLTTWFRFARVAEKMQTALVFFTSYPAARSCAGLTLHMNADETLWSSAGTAQCTCPAEGEHPLARVLEGAECKIEIGRMRKPVQSVQPNFTATAKWK